MSERRDFIKDASKDLLDRILPQQLRQWIVETPLSSKNSQIHSKKFTKRKLLLSTDDPINNAAERFGGEVSSIVYLKFEMGKALLLLGHASTEHHSGITTIEFRNHMPLWNSPHTQRWHSKKEIAALSERFEQQKLVSASKTVQGPERILKLMSTPWNSVLAFDQKNGLYEYSTETHSLKFCSHFEDYKIEAIHMIAENGKAVQVLFKDKNNKYYRYQSHQFFDSRIQNHNHRLMTCGHIEEIEPLQILENAHHQTADSNELELITETFILKTEIVVDQTQVRKSRVWMFYE